MDKNKINKNEDKDNHLSNNQKTSIDPKRHISQKFSTTLVNQKESIFIDNLSKEIDRYNKLKRIIIYIKKIMIWRNNKFIQH